MSGVPKQRPARRLAGRGALFILALMLAASGAVRLGSGFGEVWASAGKDAPEAAAPQECPLPPLAVTEALIEREQRLATREAAVAERVAALTLADQAIEDRMRKLVAAETALNETLSRADGAAEADLAKLTAVYESMKPKGAAELFDAMAPEFASGFLARMRPDAAAAILSGMKPDMAYAVSLLLAGRNAEVPKE